MLSLRLKNVQLCLDPLGTTFIAQVAKNLMRNVILRHQKIFIFGTTFYG